MQQNSTMSIATMMQQQAVGGAGSNVTTTTVRNPYAKNGRGAESQQQSNDGGNDNRAFGSDTVQPQPQQYNRANPYGNNVSNIDYYRDAYNRSMALRAEESKQHDQEIERGQTLYDAVCDELEATENRLRAMKNANTHWYNKYTEANIQKETFKNVAQDAHNELHKNIEELASVKMMHDVHKNQKEKYKQSRDLYKASYDKEKLEHDELKDKHNKMKRDRERDEWKEKEKEKKRGCAMM